MFPTKKLLFCLPRVLLIESPFSRLDKTASIRLECDACSRNPFFPGSRWHQIKIHLGRWRVTRPLAAIEYHLGSASASEISV